MNKVYIAYRENSAYPDSPFHPAVGWPEYPFGAGKIAAGNNAVYEMVRECLRGMGYDSARYGTENWNPLGEMLRPGQTVVIKPNLVMHKNENKDVRDNAMECLVTHPSCLRAICDYCVIALKGKGRIIIADAPMQGCDFEELVRKIRLDKLVDFYASEGIKVELLDLRQFQATFNRNKVIIGKMHTDSRGVLVHVGGRSAHCGSGGNEEYQVSDYDKRMTMQYHHGNTHDYLIAETVLQADLVINFCKPKTHRLAGITAAMKNMVGIAYDKAALPHRRAGSVSEDGDAYQHRSWLKRRADWALTAKIRAEAQGNFFKATMLRYCYGVFLVAGRTLGKDSYYIGSWYGNDTIWRTVADLNLIVKYANRGGILQDVPQRKMLCFGDMLIAGQHNGPVSPEPKELGVIICSEDAAAFDVTVCRMMGFRPEKIPLLRAVCAGETLIPPPQVQVKSNEESFCGTLDRIKFPANWSFMPHDGWKEALGDRKS